MSTEKADTGEVQTTGREHHSIDTPAEMERQTEDGKCASISASTENDEAEETQTTFTGCASIYKSMENAKVDETQTTSSEHECTNTSTENAEVEETQTSGSGLVNDVRPQRRHRLDLDSIAQLEQLEVDMRELQEDIRLQLDFRRLALERRTSVLGSVIKSLNYQSYFKVKPVLICNSSLHVLQTSDSYWLVEMQTLSEWKNISLPLCPEPSSVLSSLLVNTK